MRNTASRTLQSLRSRPLIPGVFCSVWREARYLELVLDQMGLCPGPKLLIWMDSPWNWTAPGTPPKGYGDPVKSLLSQRRQDLVLWSPRSEEETLAFAQGWLAGHGAEITVRMDSDTLFDLDDMRIFYRAVEELSEQRNVETNAVHYYRDFTCAHAITGLMLGYPSLCNSILASPHVDPLHVNITAYHASYVKTDTEIYEKVNSWGHADAFNKRGFYEKEWLPKDDRQMNLQNVAPPPRPIIRRLEEAGALLPWALGPAGAVFSMLAQSAS